MCHAKGYGFLAILVWNRESISTADVFPVVADTRTKSNQKQVKSIDVDKIGSKKHLASKSVLFRAELIASSFLNVIFKQVRLNAALSGFLLLSGTGCPFRQEKSLKPGGGGGTPLYKPYMYVPPRRGGVLRRFGLKTGIHFAHFWELGFRGTTGVLMNIFIISILNKKEREIWEFETNLRNFFCLHSE